MEEQGWGFVVFCCFLRGFFGLVFVLFGWGFCLVCGFFLLFVWCCVVCLFVLGGACLLVFMALPVCILAVSVVPSQQLFGY